MELTPTAYNATHEVNGKKVQCTLTRNIIGSGIEIKASSFSSYQNLSLMDLAEFIKTLCTEHGEELGNKNSISLVFSPENHYSFYVENVSKQPVEEILKQIAKEFSFDLFCSLINDTHNCE